jgi:hypothetical protein
MVYNRESDCTTTGVTEYVIDGGLQQAGIAMSKIPDPLIHGIGGGIKCNRRTGTGIGRSGGKRGNCWDTYRHGVREYGRNGTSAVCRDGKRNVIISLGGINKSWVSQGRRCGITPTGTPQIAGYPVYAVDYGDGCYPCSDTAPQVRIDQGQGRRRNPDEIWFGYRTRTPDAVCYGQFDGEAAGVGIRMRSRLAGSRGSVTEIPLPSGCGAGRSKILEIDGEWLAICCFCCGEIGHGIIDDLYILYHRIRAGAVLIDQFHSIGSRGSISICRIGGR